MTITPVVQYATVTDAVDASSYVVSGEITFASVGKKDVVTVTPADPSYLGNFTSSVTADAQTGFKDFNWSFKLNDAQIAALAAGQSVIQTYNVLINGVPDQVVITILGTNDVPTITAQTQVKGSVTEGAPGGSETAAGSFTFADKDLADTHHVTGIQLISNDNPQGLALGALNASVTTDSTGSGKGGVVTWNYAVNDAQLQFLAAGQKVTEVYQVTLSDGHGGSVTQNVTVTIVGTNDAPTISAAPITAAANAQTGHAGGSFAFADVDLVDTHSLSVSLDNSSVTWSGGSHLPAGAANALAHALSAQLADSTGTGSGAVAWSFDPASAAMDFLAAGETLTATYQIKVKDDHGASATESVTVTITGSNHAPTIVASTADRTIHEKGIARDHVDETQGHITFADSDRNDVHAASSSLSSAVLSNGHAIPAATLAALSSALTTAITDDSTGGGNGTLKWDFQLDNKLASFLGQGESLTVTYDVAVSDGHGGIVHQPVTVTVDGRNHAPTLAASQPVVLSGTVSEFASGTGSEQASGKFSFIDGDFSDIHDIKSVQLVSGGAHHPFSTLSATVAHDSANGGTGEVDWTFSVNDADIAFLKPGQIAHETYRVVVEDNNGKTLAETVRVAVTGGIAAPSVTTASGAPGAAISLAGHIAASSPDHKPLSFTISGPSSGWSLSESDGSQLTANANGSYTLTAAQLAHLQVTPAANFTGTLALNVTVSEHGVTSQASELDVVVGTGVSGTGSSGSALAPSLTIGDAVVFAGQSTALAGFISASLPANDHGSLSYLISGLGMPDGWSISGGIHNADGSYTLSAAQLAQASLNLPSGELASGVLSVTATDTEANGQTASATGVAALDVHSAPVTLNASGAITSIQENGAIGFPSAFTLVESAPGQDTVSIHISNLAAGWHLGYDDFSVPQASADGSYTIAEANLSHLLIMPPTDFVGSAAQVLTATAVVQDPLGSYMTQPVTFGLNVSSTGSTVDNSPLTVSVGGGVTSISENGAAGLASVIGIHDPLAGQDTVSVHISNLSPGWTLSFDDWSTPQAAADGSYTFAQSDLSHLLILPPQDYVGEQPHVFTVTATSTVAGVSTTTAPVDLDLQVQGPNGLFSAAPITLNDGELFSFQQGDGALAIQNYVPAAAGGTDQIDLSAFGLANTVDFGSLVTDVGNNAVIEPLANDPNDTITLLGVHKAQLTAADFHLH